MVNQALGICEATPQVFHGLEIAESSIINPFHILNPNPITKDMLARFLPFFASDWYPTIMMTV